MSSFSCPHLNIAESYCIRLKVDCVPGRKGCVLYKKYAFAVPAEERVKNLEAKKRESKHKKER